MSRISSHRCVYFDDGGFEPVCGCGQRAMYLDDPAGAILVLVDDDVAAVTARILSDRLVPDFAVSA